MKNLRLKAVLLATTFALTVPFAGVAFAQGTPPAATPPAATTAKTAAEIEADKKAEAEIAAQLPNGITIATATPAQLATAVGKAVAGNKSLAARYAGVATALKPGAALQIGTAAGDNAPQFAAAIVAAVSKVAGPKVDLTAVVKAVAKGAKLQVAALTGQVLTNIATAAGNPNTPGTPPTTPVVTPPVTPPVIVRPIIVVVTPPPPPRPENPGRSGSQS